MKTKSTQPTGTPRSSTLAKMFTLALGLAVAGINLTPSAQAATDTWSGLTNGVWDINSTSNWLHDGTDTVFNSGNDALFTGTPATNVTAATGLTIGAITLDSTFTGTVALTGANTVAGATTISGGVLDFTANDQLGASAVTLNGGTLRMSSASAVSYTHGLVVGASGGTVNVSGKQLTVNTTAPSGSGALMVTGDGTLNSGDGNFNNAFTLAVASSTYSGNLTVQNGAILEFNANSAAGTAAITVGSQGELAYVKGKTMDNAITLDGGTMSFADWSTTDVGTVGTSGGITLASGGGTMKTTNFYGNGGATSANRSANISAVISGTGALTKTGGGTLTLSGNNSYSGGTIVNVGELKLQHASGLGTGDLTLNGGIFQGNINNATITNNIIVSGDAGFFLNANLTTSGTITGSGTLDNTVWNGGASWNITGDISGFTGTFKYLAGTNNQNNVNIGATTDASMDMSQAKIQVSGNTSGGARALTLGGSGPGATFKVGDLNGSGQVRISNGLTLEVGALGLNSTYSGVISAASGTAAVRKTGAGTWTLSGANTYNGATTVSSGTLALGASGSINNSATIDVQSGATLDVTLKSGFTVGASQTLKGSGSIFGNVTVSGTVAPGSSPGILTVTGSLTLAGVTALELASNTNVPGTSHDNINVSQTLTYGGALTISSFGGYDLTQPATYNLFTAGTYASDFASVSVGGNALTLDSGVWSATVGASTYTFTQSTGALLVVPEPGTFAMMLGGLGMLALIRRRRA